MSVSRVRSRLEDGHALFPLKLKSVLLFFVTRSHEARSFGVREIMCSETRVPTDIDCLQMTMPADETIKTKITTADADRQEAGVIRHTIIK